MNVTRALRSVPTSPPRILGAVRVSKERDGMVSPEIQRASIADYCSSRGYDITGWVEGIDESGSRAKSAWWPTLERAVGSVESGEYDGIVVWKFGRVARNRLRWATALDRVETSGGMLESATEQFDTTTSAGRLARGMIAELNAFEAERIGEGWKEAHARRVSTGRPASGKPRWGYRYDQATKLHVPDLETGPVLADLYRRYVAGESFYLLVRWLNAHGYRTLADGPWWDRRLREVMDSGFAAGRFTHRGEVHEGIHERLVDETLWQAYQDSRALRRSAPARRERSQYVLSGLVRCARCGSPMVAGQYGRGGVVPQYRCKAAKASGPSVCTGGYVLARFVEDVVLEWLHEVAGSVENAQDAALATRSLRATARSEVARLTRLEARASNALTRLAVQDAEHPLPREVYRRAHEELSAELQQLSATRLEAEREVRQVVRSPRKVARQLLSGWHTTRVHARRTLLATLVDRVEVTTGRNRRFVLVTAWGERWEPPGVDR
jgi:site-specific DNA recombinase